jgi:hypothetical protein
MLIDVAILAEKNVTQNMAEKAITYESLRLNIQLMWSCVMYDHSDNMWSHRSSNKGVETSLAAVPEKY